MWMDFVRFLAAFFVLFGHLRDLMFHDYTGAEGLFAKAVYFFAGFGHSGVIVFFVLSGFWIAKSVSGREVSGSFWSGYLIDRFARLWIVILPALFLGTALDYLGESVFALPVYFGIAEVQSVKGVISDTISPKVFLGNVVFLQGLWVAPLGSNVPLWSLAYEFWFYIWFPSLFLFLRHRKLSLGLLSLGVALVYPDLVHGFLCWLVGAASFFCLPRLARMQAPAVLPKIAVITTAVILMAVLFYARLRQPSWGDLVTAVAFGSLMLSVLLLNPRFPITLEGLRRYGAESSFSLYALHFPVAIFLTGFVTNEGLLAPDPINWLILAFLCAVCLLTAQKFSTLTEKNTAWAKRYFKNILV